MVLLFTTQVCIIFNIIILKRIINKNKIDYRITQLIFWYTPPVFRECV